MKLSFLLASLAVTFSAATAFAGNGAISRDEAVDAVYRAGGTCSLISDFNLLSKTSFFVLVNVECDSSYRYTIRETYPDSTLAQVRSKERIAAPTTNTNIRHPFTGGVPEAVEAFGSAFHKELGSENDGFNYITHRASGAAVYAEYEVPQDFFDADLTRAHSKTREMLGLVLIMCDLHEETHELFEHGYTLNLVAHSPRGQKAYQRGVVRCPTMDELF